MAKGYCPTDDPAWHHDHVLTGETGHCARKGCKATWPVACHSGHRRYCEQCGRAVRRERDRQAKADRRFAKREQAAELEAFLFVPASNYTAKALTLRQLGFGHQQTKRLLEDWTGYLMDDDGQGDDDIGKLSFADWIAIETDVP